MMPPIDPNFRSPTGELVAGPPAEDIGDYIIAATKNSHGELIWFVKGENPLGPENDFVIMAIATSLARARHVAAALACLDAASLFMSFMGRGLDREVVEDFFKLLRGYLRFADVGPG